MEVDVIPVPELLRRMATKFATNHSKLQPFLNDVKSNNDEDLLKGSIDMMLVDTEGNDCLVLHSARHLIAKQ